MNSESNEMLTALYKFWEWEADWMTCRRCKRHLIASRDGEPFLHADGCKNAELLHPWRSLRLILADGAALETCPAPARKDLQHPEAGPRGDRYPYGDPQ